MLTFLLFAAACCWLYGKADERRQRANRARAVEMLKRARLGRVLKQAVDELPVVTRWQLTNLASGNPERLRLVYDVVDELEERGEISEHEAELILEATALAGRR